MSIPESFDLREFFRSVGHFSGERALTVTPSERPEPTTPAILLEEDNQKVSSKPLAIAAFVDGIQASLCVTYREHRPVYLNYVAAGAVGHHAKVLRIDEKLTVVCSSLDVEWVKTLGENLPIEELAATMPLDVERAALHILGGDRESFERALVQDLSSENLGTLCLDGSLLGRPPLNSLVGVVKSTGKKYLADESPLYRLPAGWRSAIFKIPENTAGVSPDRYSCYLRLFNADNKSWNFGLIRLEAFTPELLDPLAARALMERQNPAAGDPRFDRHLESMHTCEEVMRSRRPAVFSIGN